MGIVKIVYYRLITRTIKLIKKHTKITRTMVAPLAVCAQSCAEMASPVMEENVAIAIAHQNIARKDIERFLAAAAGKIIRAVTRNTPVDHTAKATTTASKIANAYWRAVTFILWAPASEALMPMYISLLKKQNSNITTATIKSISAPIIQSESNKISPYTNLWIAREMPFSLLIIAMPNAMIAAKATPMVVSADNAVLRCNRTISTAVRIAKTTMLMFGFIDASIPIATPVNIECAIASVKNAILKLNI